MIAFDTNVLVYAHRDESPRYEAAARVMRGSIEGTVPFGVPVFAVAEFLRVVTHPTYLDAPSSGRQASDFVDSVLRSPAARLLCPTPAFWRLLREELVTRRVRGNDVFDTQIGVVCREHGVDTVVTEDRAFARSTGLRTMSLAEATGPRLSPVRRR